MSVVQSLLLLILINHVVACAWFFIGDSDFAIEDAEWHWVDYYEVSDKSMGQQYTGY